MKRLVILNLVGFSMFFPGYYSAPASVPGNPAAGRDMGGGAELG
jgi:hypothetical protein